MVGATDGGVVVVGISAGATDLLLLAGAVFAGAGAGAGLELFFSGAAGVTVAGFYCHLFFAREVLFSSISSSSSSSSSSSTLNESSLTRIRFSSTGLMILIPTFATASSLKFKISAVLSVTSIIFPSSKGPLSLIVTSASLLFSRF